MKQKSLFAKFCNQILIASVLFGTLVGAGFASGKETWYYFASFGTMGYISIGVAAITFFLCALLFMNFGRKMGVSSVQDMNKAMFGKGAILGEFALVFCNLILLASMFAGANSLFEIVVSDSIYRYASVATAIITLLIVCFGFKGITKVNLIVVPLMLAVLVVVFCASISHPQTYFEVNNFTLINVVESLVYCILFISSNMFFAGFIFAKLGKDYSKSETVGGSLIGALFLTLSLVAMAVTLNLNPQWTTSDMPLVAIAGTMGNAFSIFVLIVVWIGLLTTAVALLYTVTNWLKTYFGGTFFAALTATLLAMVMSGFGFASFVAYVYPVFGIVGLIYIAILAKANNKKVIKTEKEPETTQIQVKTDKA